MRSVCRKFLLLLPFSVISFIATSQNFQATFNLNLEFEKLSLFIKSDDLPVATNDTINFCPNCGEESVYANIMINDEVLFR